MADEMVKNGSGFEMARAVWKRRKWLGILVFTASFAGAIGFILSLPRIYQSTATVIVEPEQVPQDFVKSTVTGEVQTRLQTINEQVISRARLKQIIELYSLYRDPRRQAPLDELVEKMRRDINLELKTVEENTGRRATFAFALSYRGRDPQKVAQVTNTLASFFIEENWKTRGRQATETADFFRVQLDQVRRRLDEQERQVSQVKSRVGEGSQQAQANMMAMERLNNQLRLNMERLDRVMERKEKISAQLAEARQHEPGPRGEPPVKRSERLERLSKLRQELAELRTNYTESYPDVIRVKSEIAALERGAPEVKSPRAPAKEPEDPVGKQLKQAMGNVETEINSLKSEERRLQQAIAAYQTKMESVPAREPQFPELLREYETTKELYASLLKRYADAQQAENLERRQKGEKFRTLDPAIPARSPVAPKPFPLAIMSLALSLGLAVVAVVLAEQADSTFHSIHDLRAFTKVPVVATIPPIITKKDMRQRQRRLGFMLAGAMAGLILIAGASYYMGHENEQVVRILMRSRQ
ncbi:MAG: hypothetical protein HY695_20295 [Deltaproteobacteria bacterium]|nr:hypothetical protein [Deltaproteobacteria bacterium]